MKLRILDNSIRLRLTRTEVETVNSGGLVRGRVHFGDAKAFEYVLESLPATVTPEADISNSVMTVRVPNADVQKWAKSEQVSISAEQILEDGNRLTILVEKDFACLTPREGEDETDMFPHPNENGPC